MSEYSSWQFDLIKLAPRRHISDRLCNVAKQLLQEANYNSKVVEKIRC